MPRRSLQFPTQCHEQDCVLYVGQFRVQIMRSSGSDFAANQHSINDRKPSMPNKKAVSRKHVQAHQPTKLDAATRSNMAHQPASPAADNGADSAVLLGIAEMLTKLSPSNAQLVEKIIRCILVEQENKTQ